MSVLGKYLEKEESKIEQTNIEISELDLAAEAVDAKIVYEMIEKDFQDLDYAIEALELLEESITAKDNETLTTTGYELYKVNLKLLGVEAGYEASVGDTLKAAKEAITKVLQKVWDNIVRFVQKVVDFVMRLIGKRESTPEKTLKLLEDMAKKGFVNLGKDSFDEKTAKMLFRQLAAMYAIYGGVDVNVCRDFFKHQVRFVKLNVYEEYGIKDIAPKVETVLKALTNDRITYDWTALLEALGKLTKKGKNDLPDKIMEVIEKEDKNFKPGAKGHNYYITSITPDMVEVVLIKADADVVEEVKEKSIEILKNLDDAFTRDFQRTFMSSDLTKLYAKVNKAIETKTIKIDSVTLKDIKSEELVKNIKPVDYKSAKELMEDYNSLGKEIDRIKKETKEIKKKVYDDITKSLLNYRGSLLADFTKVYKVFDKSFFYLARRTLAGKAKAITEAVRPKVSILVKESIKLYVDSSNKPYSGLKELPNKSGQ